MSVWNELFEAVVGLCRSKCDDVARQARWVGARVALCLMAAILSLWGLGLLIAALFIGLAPRLGGAWAAMISAGAAFFAAAILGLICMTIRR